MKSQVTVVMRKDITREQAAALEEILKAPNFLKLMKTEVADRFERALEGDGYVESVEIELLEESK